MADEIVDVIGGVDTHGDVHVGAVVDNTGRILGTASFPTTPAGYRRLLSWMRKHGVVVRVGVEGTGSWGAGLARYLSGEGVEVVEVDRPNRQNRRRRGKSDPVDAVSAARAALSGEATPCRGPETPPWKRFACGGWPDRRPATTAPRPSTRCAAGSPLLPSRCASSCAA